MKTNNLRIYKDPNTIRVGTRAYSREELRAAGTSILEALQVKCAVEHMERVVPYELHGAPCAIRFQTGDAGVYVECVAGRWNGEVWAVATFSDLHQTGDALRIDGEPFGLTAEEADRHHQAVDRLGGWATYAGLIASNGSPHV